MDARARTQAFFDNNKGADVTNPNRALTDRIRKRHELIHKSTLPSLTPVPDATRAPKGKVSTKHPSNLNKGRGVVAEDQVKQAAKEKASSRNAQMVAEATPANVNQVTPSAKQAGQQTEKQKKSRQTESRSARESFSSSFKQIAQNLRTRVLRIALRKLRGWNSLTYPVRWSELMRDIFHPLPYEYLHRILQLDMAPLLENYKCRRRPASLRRSHRLVCVVRALQRS